MKAASGWKQRSLWIAAQVLRATGEESDVRERLAAAHAIYLKVAEQLDGAELERFQAVTWNREIVSAHAAGVWPELQLGPGPAATAIG
jgi:hypothetical protein